MSTSNLDLFAIARKNNIRLDDVVTIENLKAKKLLNSNKTSIIINLNGHWVAVYITHAASDNAYYFDSFGEPPPYDIMKAIVDIGISKIVYNDIQIQDINHGHCGQYCLIFLLLMQSKVKQ